MLGLLTLFLPGCFSYHPTTRFRTQPAAALEAAAFPRRDPAAVETIRISTASSMAAPSPASIVIDVNQAAGQGLLRLYHQPPAEGDSDHPPLNAEQRRIQELFDELIVFKPNGSFLTSHWLTRQARRHLGEPDAPAASVDDGIEFFLPPPEQVPPLDSQRGLILHFWSLSPNAYEQRILDQLRAVGWVVVDFDTTIDVELPLPPGAAERLSELQARLRAAQAATRTGDRAQALDLSSPAWTEYSRLLAEIINLRRGGFDLAPEATPEQIDAIAADMARTTDTTIAENAFAAEAVLQHIREHRPDIRIKPLVIAGFSAGALATPAICARLAATTQAPDAAILVGGGADLLALTRGSSLKQKSQPVTSKGARLSDDLFTKLDAAYLRHTRLDPYTTAPLLAHTPVLQVHARADTVVPAATGELLYERLGRPDRYDFIADHYKLFYFMAGEPGYGKLIRWLDHTLPPSDH